MGERRQQQITVMVFAIVLGALAILCLAALLQPARATSELENRALAQRPAFPTRAHGLSKYARAWDSYLVDQVPFRDVWVRSYYLLQVRALGKTEMNGVVIGRSGYLFGFPTPPGTNRKQLDKTIDSVVSRVAGFEERVRAGGGHLLYVVVPGKGSIFPEYYPFFAPYPTLIDDAEREFFAGLEREGVDGLALRVVLAANRDERPYYQTDHHWTFAGAYLGYRAIMERLGLSALNREDLDLTTLPNPFLGSRNRSLGMAIPTNDAISVGTSRDPAPYDLTVNAKSLPQGTRLYRLPAQASEPVSYSTVYPYANSAELLIDTHRPDLPDLLVIGDSFKGPIDGLVYSSFDQTRVVDLRRYSTMSMTDYVDKYKPDYVVILVNGNSYIQPPWNVFDKPSSGDWME